MVERKPPAMGPGRRVVYRPDHSMATGMGGFLLSDQMRDVTEKVAKDIAKRAGELAPRSKGNGPHMADEFRVVRDAGKIKVHRAFRVRVDVVNENRAAAPSEFGGQKNRRHRMLGRAGAAFGDFKGPNKPEGV